MEAGGAFYPADAVIATVPTPYISGLVPDLSEQEREAYGAVINIGVVCVVFRLKRSVSPHFWINISDRRFQIPGIIEFSNLRPIRDTVVYVPYYMPTTNPKFARDDQIFREEAFTYLKLLRPGLSEHDIIGIHIGRLRHAQPVCPPGFAGNAASHQDFHTRSADCGHLLLLP